MFQADLDLNLKHDVHFEANYSNLENWLGKVMSDLAVRHVDYDLSDTHVDAARLARYPIVYLQATDFMSPQDQAKLVDYVKQGGQLIVGPGMPYLDAALKPASVLSQYLKQPGTVAIGQGQLTWAPAEALANVVLPAAGISVRSAAGGSDRAAPQRHHACWRWRIRLRSIWKAR